jgi:hypothetical protein
MRWSHKKNKRHFDVCEMDPSSSKKERHNVIKQRRVSARIKTSKGILPLFHRECPVRLSSGIIRSFWNVWNLLIKGFGTVGTATI